MVCAQHKSSGCTANTLFHVHTLCRSSLCTDNGQLDYKAFFNDKVEAKRKDNSYRMFRVMARQADQFPHASHYPDPNMSYEEGRNVTVWCSNDYMGMSKHPEVVKATM